MRFMLISCYFSNEMEWSMWIEISLMKFSYVVGTIDCISCFITSLILIALMLNTKEASSGKSVLCCVTLPILYLRVFFHDNSTNKMLRYSRYQVSKLTRNNGVFRKWCLSQSHNIQDHEYHRPQIHWLTWTKSCRSHTLVRKGESLKISKQEVKKSKEEVKVGEYWQTIICHESPFYHVHLELVSNITLSSGDSE